MYEDDTLPLKSKSLQNVHWFKNGVLFASNTPHVKVTEPGIYNYSLSSTVETTCENNSNSVHIGECREFKGTFFLDSIHNDSLDVSERKISNLKLYIPELNITFFTDENGYFSFELPQTSNYFSIIVADNFYLKSSYKFYYNPLFKEYTINYYNILTGKYFTTIKKDLIFLKLPIYKLHNKDIGVTMISSAIRPGFDNKHILSVRNNGNEALQGFLTLEYKSPVYDPNKEDEATVTHALKKEQWSIDLAAGAETTIVHSLKALTSATLGSYVSLKAYITFPGDGEVVNDTAYTSVMIRGSFDPNDKTVTPVGPSYEDLILKSSKLDYTIRFQNTGNDTAFTVVVKDTLDHTLDPKSLLIKKVSHPYKLEVVNNILTWTFSNILLIDSTTNEPLSHGFIQYNIQQKQNNPEGAEIRNQAAIYFDFNKPVMTNVTYNKVVNLLPSAPTHIVDVNHSDYYLYPNPSDGHFTISSEINAKFKLVDQMGRVLLQSTIIAGTQSVDISHLEPGIYFYSFEGGKSQKLLIQ